LDARAEWTKEIKEEHPSFNRKDENDWFYIIMHAFGAWFMVRSKKFNVIKLTKELRDSIETYDSEYYVVYPKYWR